MICNSCLQTDDSPTGVAKQTHCLEPTKQTLEETAAQCYLSGNGHKGYNDVFYGDHDVYPEAECVILRAF